MITNEELAEKARLMAESLEVSRRIAMVAHAALVTTSSVAAARGALIEWDGPAPFRNGAMNLLSDLTGADLPKAA